MNQVTDQHLEERPTRPHPITVTVNGHKVIFRDDKATGLEIKQTAIDQGVSIQLDFALFLVNPGGHLKQIRDDERVHLKDGDVFRAVTPDDNS